MNCLHCFKTTVVICRFLKLHPKSKHIVQDIKKEIVALGKDSAKALKRHNLKVKCSKAEIENYRSHYLIQAICF